MRRQPPLPDLSQILPPLKPTGNNGADARTIFEERKKYRDVLTPLFPFVGTNSKNFWGEDRLYGRINLVSDPVLPKESRLKQLRYAAEGEALYALDFVADAWRDLAARLRDLTANEVFFVNSPWAEPIAHRAYISPEASYSAYMEESIYPVFASIYMSTLDSNPVVYTRDSNMKDFSDFLTLFSDYFVRIVSQVGALTLSGFIESPAASPNMSGLVIEISNHPHDDDITKFWTFMLDENFPLLQEIIQQYGFSIDVNAPWRLVANLESQAMREYMKGVPIEGRDYPLNTLDDCDDVIAAPTISPRDPYGFSQLEGMESVARHAEGYAPYRNLVLDSDGGIWYKTLFATAYRENWLADVNILKLHLIKFYNDYIENKPFLSIHRTNPCLTGGSNVVTTPYLYRRELAESGIMSSEGAYGDKWSVRAFFNLRRLEKGLDLSAQQQYRALREALNIYDFSPGSPVQKLDAALQNLQERYIRGLAPAPLTIYRVGDSI